MFFTVSKQQRREGVGREVKKYLKEELEISQSNAAKRLGMSPQLFGKYLLGKAGFGEKVALRLKKEFGFNPEFLTTGDGPLLWNDAQKEDADFIEFDRELDHQISILTREYGPENVLRSLLNSLLSNNNSCTTISFNNEIILLGRTTDQKGGKYFEKWWLRGLR